VVPHAEVRGAEEGGVIQVTMEQGLAAVRLILALSDAARDGRDIANELRLGDSFVKEIVALADAIMSNDPGTETGNVPRP
jgi:hypothetical protein